MSLPRNLILINPQTQTWSCEWEESRGTACKLKLVASPLKVIAEGTAGSFGRRNRKDRVNDVLDN